MVAGRNSNANLGVANEICSNLLDVLHAITSFQKSRYHSEIQSKSTLVSCSEITFSINNREINTLNFEIAFPKKYSCCANML